MFKRLTFVQLCGWKVQDGVNRTNESKHVSPLFISRTRRLESSQDKVSDRRPLHENADRSMARAAIVEAHHTQHSLSVLCISGHIANVPHHPIDRYTKRKLQVD